MNPQADHPASQSVLPQRAEVAHSRAASRRACVALAAALLGIALISHAAVIVNPDRREAPGQAAKPDAVRVLAADADSERPTMFDVRNEGFAAEFLRTDNGKAAIEEAYGSAYAATSVNETASGRVQQVYSPQSESVDPNRAFEVSMVVTTLAFLAFGVIGLLICAGIDD